jgi:hypothetical protein
MPDEVTNQEPLDTTAQVDPAAELAALKAEHAALQEKFEQGKGAVDWAIKARQDPRYAPVIEKMLEGQDIEPAKAPAPPPPPGPQNNPYDAIATRLGHTLDEATARSVQEAVEPVFRQVVSMNDSILEKRTQEMQEAFDKKLGEMSSGLVTLKSQSNLRNLLRSDKKITGEWTGKHFAPFEAEINELAEKLPSNIPWENVMEMFAGQRYLSDNGKTLSESKELGERMIAQPRPGMNPMSAEELTRAPFPKDRKEGRTFESVFQHHDGQFPAMPDADRALWGLR